MAFLWKSFLLSRLDFPHAIAFPVFAFKQAAISLAEAEGIPGIGPVKFHAVVPHVVQRKVIRDDVERVRVLCTTVILTWPCRTRRRWRRSGDRETLTPSLSYLFKLSTSWLLCSKLSVFFCVSQSEKNGMGWFSEKTAHNSLFELNLRWGRVPISKPPKTENLGREVALRSDENATYWILCGERESRLFFL